jgi:hypothetical protein|tara:strand:+ start:1237 stop:1443 length:207 start_codon:yes stop_codon:yes gene_type:complete
MTNPFVPAEPEKMIQAEVSAREFVLIIKLRKYPFGKFVVHKANNILVRVEIQDSQLIKEEDGLDLSAE